MMATMTMSTEPMQQRLERLLVQRPAGTVERNRRLYEAQLSRRRGPTPEMFFTKHIDNSRLMKEDDPVTKRKIRNFFGMWIVVCTLTMVYVGQHVAAIDMGYNIEASKLQLEQLRETNRRLRLSEAELSDPSRIDHLAQQLGMGATLPGQVIGAHAPSDSVVAQAHVPVMQAH